AAAPAGARCPGGDSVWGAVLGADPGPVDGWGEAGVVIGPHRGFDQSRAILHSPSSPIMTLKEANEPLSLPAPDKFVDTPRSLLQQDIEYSATPVEMIPRVVPRTML